MITLSTCTTVPSMWSRHIAVSFLRTYRGCRHARRMLIMDRHFLYSFFLILEFLLWASCPWPNHCCLTQVSHGEQKQKTHSLLSPSSSVASFPWPEWLTSTPAVTLMALAQLSQSLPQHSLQWYRMWQEMSRRNLGKEEKNFMNIIPSTCFKQFFYCDFLLTVKPKQSQSQSIHFPGIASCLHLSSGGKTIVFETYLVQWNVTQSSCHDPCLGNR